MIKIGDRLVLSGLKAGDLISTRIGNGDRLRIAHAVVKEVKSLHGIFYSAEIGDAAGRATDIRDTFDQENIEWVRGHVDEFGAEALMAAVRLLA